MLRNFLNCAICCCFSAAAGAHGAPVLREPRVDLGVLEALELPRERRGDGAAVELLSLDGREQRARGLPGARASVLMASRFSSASSAA